MSKSPLVFLHLSDIHFNKKELDYFDPDIDLRLQLEKDAREQSQKLKRVDGILVTGDIAFRADVKEYEIAYKWLNSLSEQIGCDRRRIWCVPGNHDVNRSLIDNGWMLQSAHKQLRPPNARDIDDAISGCLRDTLGAELLFSPLSAYNSFANNFRCPSKPSPLHWEFDLTLNDGSTLRLWGINSALVSDSNDENEKVVIGSRQATPPTRDGVTYLVMCHHPVDWLRDGEIVEKLLNNRAIIQLYGHKHNQVIDEHKKYLRIVSGAVQPNRREPNWKPRYNWIAISVDGVADHRQLSVEVYPRVWSSETPSFVHDHDRCEGKDSLTFTAALPHWVKVMPKDGDAGKAPDKIVVGSSVNPNEDVAKNMAYDFLSLPHLIRILIAQRLNLLKNEDEGLQDFDLFDRIYARAVASDKVNDLSAEIKKHQ